MKPDWDKITEEAFSSDEDHVFSVSYIRRRDELLRGAEKESKDKRKGISVKCRAGLGMAATAAALILIPAATMIALNLAPKGSGESLPDSRQNASITDNTVPGTEIPAVTEPDIVYEGGSSARHLSRSEIYDLLRYSAANYDRVSGELVESNDGGYSTHSVKFACDLGNTRSFSQSVYLGLGWQDGGRYVQVYEKNLYYGSIAGVDGAVFAVGGFADLGLRVVGEVPVLGKLAALVQIVLFDGLGGHRTVGGGDLFLGRELLFDRKQLVISRKRRELYIIFNAVLFLQVINIIKCVVAFDCFAVNINCIST